MADFPTTIKNLNTLLGTQLLDGGGGGGSWTVLTEESVTTRMGQDAAPYGDITYSQLIDAETIKVTFNGVEYECPRIGEGGEYFYGGVGSSGPDFSEYPFAIMSHNDNNTLFTETTGTYTIKIEAPQSGGSSDFSTATVTIVGTTPDVEFECVSIDEDGMHQTISVSTGSGTATVVLYQGSASLINNNEYEIMSISGDIEYDVAMDEYIITGDCTITIS